MQLFMCKLDLQVTPTQFSSSMGKTFFHTFSLSLSFENQLKTTGNISLILLFINHEKQNENQS